MPSGLWVDPFAVFEANDAVEIALANQFDLHQSAGEPFYVLQIRWDLDEVTRTVASWQRTTTGFASEIWRGGVDPDGEFPDPERCRAWMIPPGRDAEIELEAAPLSENFVPNRPEFSIYRQMDMTDGAGRRLPNVIYLVMNAPPHDGQVPVRLRYSPISPATDIERRQPGVDNAEGFSTSLRGFRQWKDPQATFREEPMPHVIPIAVPDDPRELRQERDGKLRVSEIQWVTSPPPYAPALCVGDILVRRSNGARYEIKSLHYDWGIGFDGSAPLLKEQKFAAVLIGGTDPRNDIAIDDK